MVDLDLASHPALWGFAGATFYAGTQLSTALWGGEGEPDLRHRKRAWSRFTLALFFGPLAAAALTRPAISFLLHGHGTVAAVGLAIGLSCNALWPLFVDGVGKEFGRALGAMLKRWGSALTNGEDE